MRHLIFLLILFLSCDGKKQDQPQEKHNTTEGINKSYAKNGKLLNEVALKDGKRNGLSKSYYSNGKVNLEIPYKNDKREGTSRRFYENGKLYQETQYVDDQMQGMQKKYGEDGKLLSEAVFKAGRPCQGLKEYNDDGSLKSTLPTITVTPEDKMNATGFYILKVRLSNQSKKVIFYEGKLSQEGCIGSSLNMIPLDVNTGIGEIKYSMPPGKFVMEELNIVAEVKSHLGNSYLIQRSYHLAIENR